MKSLINNPGKFNFQLQYFLGNCCVANCWKMQGLQSFIST